MLIDEQRFRHDCRNGLIRHLAVDIEVLLMKNTDDLIDGIPVDQQTGEAGLCKGSGNFLVALVDVHGLQFDAMRQNFRRRQVAELKGVAQQLTLIFVNAAVLLHVLHEKEQFLVGHFCVVICLEEARNGLLDWTGNPLSELYRDAMRDITTNYHIYFFFPAFLSSFAVVKLCKKYSVSPALSLLVFFSIGTYVMYIAALKQCFAMFFLLLALPYAIDKKYVRFYLLVFVAVLFHTHAFMFAIVPLLFGKPWGKVTIAFFGAALFAMATYDATLGAFMEYAQSMGALVAEIEVFDNNAINVLRVAVYWVPALLTLVFRKRLFSNSTRAENLFANMSLISAFILMIGLVQAANLFARMAAYFEIATAITLPWMIKKLFTKRSAQYVTACAAVLYFIYFLYEFGVSKGFGSGYSSITLWQFITSLFGG